MGMDYDIIAHGGICEGRKWSLLEQVTTDMRNHQIANMQRSSQVLGSIYERDVNGLIEGGRSCY